MGDLEDTRYILNDIAADGEGNIYLAGKKTIHTEPDPVTWTEYRDVMFFCKTGPDGSVFWAVEDTAFHRAEKIVYDHDSLYVLGSREEYRAIFNGGTIDTTSRCYYGSCFFELLNPEDKSNPVNIIVLRGPMVEAVCPYLHPGGFVLCKIQIYLLILLIG